ncbi:MAG: hypothetical protein Q4C47_05345, partial [Planctomycetia bacterium]|nr:hypothetical protein [Planctomycetia bacterium]
IQQGDIHVRPAGETEYQIARKPPRKILATMRPVSDSTCVPERLVQAGLALSWADRLETNPGDLTSVPDCHWETTDGQSFRAVTGQVTTTVPESESDAGTVDSGTARWLTYQHTPLTYRGWEAVLRGGRVPEGTLEQPPAQLVTDFLSYNMTVFQGDREGYTPHEAEGGARTFPSEGSIPGVTLRPVAQRSGDREPPHQGVDLIRSRQMEPHWVGDLILEADLTIEPTSSGQNPESEVILSLVKGGRQFYAVLNLASGVVTLGIERFGGEEFGRDFAPRAQTPILYPGTYRLRLANVDDRLTLWVDDVVQEFSDEPVWSRPVSGWCPTEADLTPVRIGCRRHGREDGGITISGLKLYRDLYYIATRDNVASPELNNGIPWRSGGYEDSVVSFLSTPSQWELYRRAPFQEFELGEDQYLFLGDNSACSLDGRQWVSNAGYGEPERWGWDRPQYWVDRELLKGKAVFLFWPHSWYYIRRGGEPLIPLLPNVERMKRIR